MFCVAGLIQAADPSPVSYSTVEKSPGVRRNVARAGLITKASAVLFTLFEAAANGSETTKRPAPTTVSTSQSGRATRTSAATESALLVRSYVVYRVVVVARLMTGGFVLLRTI